jgi:hypothetical protein
MNREFIRQIDVFSWEWVNTQEKNPAPQEHGVAEEKEKEILTFRFTRYYSPVRGQSFWYQSEEYDFNMNCQWDCTMTAGRHRLVPEDAGKVVACPTEFKFWTRIYITDYGEVTCRDRWAWINKDKNWVFHLDLRAWLGEQGVTNIRKNIVWNPGVKTGYVIE